MPEHSHPEGENSGSLAESLDEQIGAVVEELCSANGIFRGPDSSCYDGLPSRAVLREIVEDLRSVLFPGYHGTSEVTGRSMAYHVGATLDQAIRSLRLQIKRGYCFIGCEGGACQDCEQLSLNKTRAFLAQLPRVHRLLNTDVRAHFEGDPAATSAAEAIFCYPGLQAITNYRVAHELYRLDVPLIPRIITELAHSETGIDIHPGATIGETFFIDHGTGVVVGETCEIGDRVRIYQGVTLGAKSFALDADGNPIKGIPRHPVVEDDVIIYSGATILGRVTIGRGAVIGGNVWLTEGVPAGGQITQAAIRQEQFEAGGGI